MVAHYQRHTNAFLSNKRQIALLPLAHFISLNCLPIDLSVRVGRAILPGISDWAKLKHTSRQIRNHHTAEDSPCPLLFRPDK
jgi:hypothetical protein